MIRRMFLATVCGIMSCCPSIFADEDPIKVTLSRAKDDYNKEVDLIHEELLALLKEKQAAAKKAGNLETLEKIQAEIDAFDQDDVLPKLVSTRAYKKSTAKAIKKMEDAYGAARKAYTQADRIDEAKATDKELEEFKALLAGEPDSASAEVTKKLLDASKISMRANPNLYFHVCEALPGERVLRATRRRYVKTPHGKHPEEPKHPLRDVLLSSYGAEPSAVALRQLTKMCEMHNATIKGK